MSLLPIRSKQLPYKKPKFLGIFSYFFGKTTCKTELILL